MWNEDRITDECKAELMRDAADALEKADKRIAELEAQNELKDGTLTAMASDIGKLRAQMPKRGEWIWDSDTGTYHCSECNATSPQEDQDGDYIDCPNYCPNCGAKMDGAEDGKDL
jgi:DNA-directed RNA polymerase subunit RPC12/RpoP